MPLHKFYMRAIREDGTESERVHMPNEVDSVNLAVEAAERQAHISGCRFKVYSETLLAEVGL